MAKTLPPGPIALYRMATPDHLCPYGQLAEQLLREQGLPFEDHLLSSQAEVERFKSAHGVATTPQIFAGRQRLGGYSDLARTLGVKPRQPGGRTYRPVVVVFATAALLSWAIGGSIEQAMGLALALLACLKLMDPAAFRSSFRKYDLLSQRLGVYGTLYPYLELAIGLGILSMQASAPIGVVAIGVVAIAMGLEGALSVIKAVYVDQLDLNCACVGGNSRTPLGLVSVLENLAMVAMGASQLLTR